MHWLTQNKCHQKHLCNKRKV